MSTFPQGWRRNLRLLRSRILALSSGPLLPRPGQLCFRCNVCSARNVVDLATLGREDRSCRACQSTLRFRSIVAALSFGLYRNYLTLAEFTPKPSLRGLGLSDWSGYADRLVRLFDYTNTFYDREPRLDILDPPAEFCGRFDFLVSSDVFEHVSPPVSVAFQNARRLLREGGLLIFSVPYKVDGLTVEHFPELHDFEILEEHGIPALVNVTRDGRKQHFRDLVFHGGSGQTLEMRVFSESGVLEQLRAAGFRELAIQWQPVFEHGIWWRDRTSLPILARA